ncbi:hypothetical protein ACFOOP_03660 [Marinicaulis aureus]|uniref:Uncharacterized protein n=1 Tax=Hyphococcus aureus TaxID=2666033 RepID=A0ABW1KWY8_9PROT
MTGMKGAKVLKLFFWLALILLPAQMAHAQSIRDGISFYTLEDVRTGTVEKCPLIPGEIGMKIYHQKNGTPPLSEAEYRTLAGDAEFFALQGDHQFYSRKTNGIVPMMEAYVILLGYDLTDPTIYQNPDFMAKLQSFTPDKMPGDIPVLCGDGEIERTTAIREARERAEREAARAEYEKNCKLCKLPGGHYLEAIYAGDFKTQDKLAKNYLYQVAVMGGGDAMAIGVLINSLGGQGNNFTYLEDVIGYYMLATSRKWNGNPKCYPSGAHKVTFTTTYPDQVYETVGGVYLGRDEGYTNTTAYSVAPVLKAACDKICNKNGGILLTARLAQGSSEKMAALEVYKGVDQMLAQHSCESEVVKQFENNLAALWDEEKSQPASVRRNTISGYFD